MKRHILDRPKKRSNALFRHAVIIERRGQPSASSLLLQRRRRRAMPAHRVMNYLRIMRSTV